MFSRSIWLLAAACAVSVAACSSAGGAAQRTGQETPSRTATLFEGARVIVGDGATTIENAALPRPGQSHYEHRPVW